MQVISFLSATAFFLSSFAGHSMAAPADSASAGSDETVGILIAITPCAYIIKVKVFDACNDS